MSLSSRKTFTAMLEQDGTRLRWVIARVPFEIRKAWPERRGRRVKGEIGGFAFRTSLFPDPAGEGLVLLVNRKMQEGAGAGVGSKVRITLEPDFEEREVVIPEELERELRSARELRRWFGVLSPSMRREIGKWVAEPKTPESRKKRAMRIAERLFQAMEGEKDPPPVLRAAFRRSPMAELGWKAMTPAQRRNHLLGIFYYETPEGRERRAAKAVDQALEVARRKKPA